MEKKNKLVQAVLQRSDSDKPIRHLHEHELMVTVLSSTGGFLKKKSTTVMIGVEEEKLEEAMEILQKFAGHRKETVYQPVTMPHGEMSSVPPVPMEVMAGGAAAMDTCLPILARYSGERYAILDGFSGMTLTLLVPVLVPALMSFR